MWLDAIQVGAAGAHFAVSMVLFGALLFPIYAGRRDIAPGLGMLRTLALIALGTAVLWFACILVSVTGDARAYLEPGKIALVLGQTAFGHAFLIRGALALLLVVALFRFAKPELASRLAFACCLAGIGLASLSGIGHAAAGEGASHWLRLSVQAVHLLAAGAWFGGLFALATALTAQGPEIRLAVRRFSCLGYVAVALITVTGLANTFFTTGALLPQLAAPYGLTLAIKLGLFLAALVVAAINRLFISPRLFDVRAERVLARNVAMEQALLTLVVLAAAALAMQSPHT